MTEAVDVILDKDGLWTTEKGEGEGSLRSIPVPGGTQRTRLWRRRTDRSLPSWVGDALAGGATQRTVALGHLLVAAIRAADHRSIPVVQDDRWAWRAAPDPERAQALHDAMLACASAGLANTDSPLDTLADFTADVVDQRISAASADVPSLPGDSQRPAIRRWADHVIARAAVNTRMTIVLSPPSETESAWLLNPMAIRIDEETTRLPWASADPQLFGASPAAWDGYVATERTMLERAWGRWLPHVRHGVSRHAVDLSDSEVIEFLDRVAPRVQAAGFDVIVPGGLLRTSPVRRRLTASRGTGTVEIASLGLQADVEVDGETLTQQELAALAASKSELVSVKGRWLRVGPGDADRLAALARRLRRGVQPADLLDDVAFEGVEMDTGALLPQGLRPARSIRPPTGVKATLRPYQVAGLEWLTWLADNEVGGVLADDMGLGKTLQVLSWIQADHEGPTLVVCPVTLVDTWARQAAEFTPGLRIQPFHGSERGPIDADIVVTTYGLLARDQSLREQVWHRVVLDEAQAIKNPDTQAARAARSLQATHRLAVTGTPVENHLGDLWSLFAFAQPGLLPRRKRFMDRYADSHDLSRLRAVVSPFVLRRVKTDPGVLPDLPDRQVIRDDCTLTREQVGAYEAVVADMVGALDELRQAAGTAGDGRQRRRATVLAGISRLKQICVHPSLLTESRRSLGDRSGKISRLVDLCAQIVDEGQAVVVFTQFASFVPDLAAHLESALAVEVATLTGSDSRKTRAATVARFSEAQGPPILIASLKAGGTGLTLVRANHVIHLDRWWNPAVEDQASDRVWRIGQHQKVSVHVLVCPGTLEDRIDKALQSKRELAASVIRSTDTAVTELSDDELTALVGLVREEVLQ
ncbi:MAG: DEAD/DEAH box helicase [Candidatus Nanopelagicales bacterium]|nr:DEAD/DEAH box helicase [Candidatus Nanopelagicales bacterium]